MWDSPWQGTLLTCRLAWLPEHGLLREFLTRIVNNNCSWKKGNDLKRKIKGKNKAKIALCTSPRDKVHPPFLPRACNHLPSIQYSAQWCLPSWATRSSHHPTLALKDKQKLITVDQIQYFKRTYSLYAFNRLPLKEKFALYKENVFSFHTLKKFLLISQEILICSKFLLFLLEKRNKELWLM